MRWPTRTHFTTRGVFAVLIIICLMPIAGCGPSAEDLASVDYAPVPGGDWNVSTPEAEGLDPDMVAKPYYDAGKLDGSFPEAVEQLLQSAQEPAR
jgi:hypothetical protein